MIDPAWAIRTPDANDLVFKSGPGPASMLAALAAYLAEMGVVEGTAIASTANMVSLNTEFQGAASVSSSTTVSAINTVAQLLFGWLAEKPPLIGTAVDAYTLAYSTMVPAPVSILNREEWTMYNALNSIFPGAFLPPMLERDSEYFGFQWPNNSRTGITYATTLLGLMPALAVPPPITPPGASPELPASAAAAVAQTAAAGAAGDTMRATSDAAGQVMTGGQSGMGSFTDIAGKALEPLQKGVEMIPKAFESVAGVPEKLVQSSSSIMQGFTGLMGSFRPDSLTATEAVRPPVTGSITSTGLGPTAGATSGGGGGGSLAGAPPVTQYTRPVSGFQQEQGGRASGLRNANLLTANEGRVPTATGGGGMPMAPAGMLGRNSGESDQQAVTKARIVLEGERTDRV